MRKDTQKAAVPQPKNFHALTTTSYQPSKPEPPQPERQPSIRRRSPWKKMILLVLAIILALLVTIVVWDIRNFSVASKKLFGTDNAWEVFRTTELQSTPGGRTNILLVGYSADDPGHAGATLTDSILILSLDKTDQSGYMLSVPRDLYVNIPDYGAAKINEAYQAGEYMKFRETGRPRGGMGLLQKVVGDTFDIELHYYALINYTSVKEVVDALGGIDVTIKSDDERGIYDPNFPKAQGGPLRLTNGTHSIDGQTALRLTRARGATYGSYGFPRSDFNRTQNQQQVFSAIKHKLDWKLVLDPRTNGEIFAAAGANIKTDLAISEVIPFYRLLTSVPNGNLKPVTLSDIGGKNFLVGYTTPSAQSALIPAAGIDDYTDIQAAIKRLQ